MFLLQQPPRQPVSCCRRKPASPPLDHFLMSVKYPTESPQLNISSLYRKERMSNPSRYVQALVCAQKNARPLPEHSCQLSEKSLEFVRWAKWCWARIYTCKQKYKCLLCCSWIHSRKELMWKFNLCKILFKKINHKCFELHSGIELLLCKTLQGLQIFHHYKRQFP